MASRQVPPPPKEHCFLFTVPDSTTSVDEIIDSVEEVTGANGVLFLQHLGGFKFLVCVKTPEQATQLLVQGSFKIAENVIQVEAVGTPCVPVNIFRLPPYISHETVAAALQPFGKVRDMYFATMHSRQEVFSGTRVAKLEMTKPAPNFLTIQGYRAMLEYRGMRRVCGKCNEEGHVAANCPTPHCDRCKSYGHNSGECNGKCRKCGREHSTKDCFLPRSYAAATRQTDKPSSEPVASTSQAPSPARTMTVLTKTPPTRSASLKATLISDMKAIAASSTQTSANASQTSAESGHASTGSYNALNEESDNSLQTSSDETNKYAESQGKTSKESAGEETPDTGNANSPQEEKQDKTEGKESQKSSTMPSPTNLDERPLRPMLTTMNTSSKGNANPKANKGTTITRPQKTNEGGKTSKAQPNSHQSRRSTGYHSSDSTDKLQDPWLPEAATTQLPDLRRDRSRSQRRPKPETTSSGGDTNSGKASQTKKARVDSPANSQHSSTEDVSDKDMF
ncbi:hypothetical protein HPB49_012886 [Dermacentor silvarum]|uniref:Uncharacterized protein n=1 Tax=Dermacentor silvarum TaxID=543639 RepID=A0ACB8CL29_DERSI|nr:hypothetical protein HPB49_012886 [Dermacentor silvarum]